MFENLLNDLNDGSNDSLELLGLLGQAGILSSLSSANQIKLKAISENARNHQATQEEIQQLREQLLKILGPQLEEIRRSQRLPKCPFCGGPVEVGYERCRHCTETIYWVRNTPFKPIEGKAEESRLQQLDEERKLKERKKAEQRETQKQKSDADKEKRELDYLAAGKLKYDDFEQRWNKCQRVAKSNAVASVGLVNCSDCASQWPIHRVLTGSLAWDCKLCDWLSQRDSVLFPEGPIEYTDLNTQDFDSELLRRCFRKERYMAFCPNCISTSLLVKCDGCFESSPRSKVISGFCWSCLRKLWTSCLAYRVGKCPSCGALRFLRDLLEIRDNRLQAIKRCNSCPPIKVSKISSMFAKTTQQLPSIREELPVSGKYYLKQGEKVQGPIKLARLVTLHPKLHSYLVAIKPEGPWDSSINVQRFVCLPEYFSDSGILKEGKSEIFRVGSWQEYANEYFRLLEKPDDFFEIHQHLVDVYQSKILIG